jgi:hypothetical protein
LFAEIIQPLNQLQSFGSSILIKNIRISNINYLENLNTSLASLNSFFQIKNINEINIDNISIDNMCIGFINLKDINNINLLNFYLDNSIISKGNIILISPLIGIEDLGCQLIMD